LIVIRAAAFSQCFRTFGAALVCLLTSGGPAFAQLKDGTPAERDMMVWATTSVGTFGNNEQFAFDVRLATPTPDRAAASRIVVEKISGSPLGETVLLMRSNTSGTFALVPILDAGPSTIRLRVFRAPQGGSLSAQSLTSANAGGAVSVPSCDMMMTREAGQFRALAQSGCASAPREILFSPRAIWTRDTPNGPYAKMLRARAFECYVDMPGSGGIHGEAFKRYENLMVDDQGTEAWFTTNEATPRQLGLRLRSVNWAMNNKPGTFTRNSLTLYLMERQPVGDPKLLTYAWTEPSVSRIGLNAQWALANCFMEANSLAKPEF
jgi:hypothetical protein